MTQETTQRPEIVTDEHLTYLDDLRESGATNMFGAGTFVQEEFGTSRQDSKDILTYWMKTFGQEDR